MKSKDIWKVLATLIVAVLFGVIMQSLKGNTLGIRNAIGNLSVPWLLLPYLSGRFVGQRKILLSAGIGLSASMVALVGLYATDPLVWNLGHQGLAANMLLTLEAGRRWFLLAFVSGPVFGTLAACKRSHQANLIMGGVSTLIILEPFAHVIYNNLTNSPMLPGVVLVWAGEFFIGIIITWGTIKRLKLTQ